MKPSIEKLQKFFKLEADRGYDNKAVLGGLSCMLDSWIADARDDNIKEELIQVVSSRLTDYDHLSEASRKDALHGLWNRLKRELGNDDVKSEKEPDPSPTISRSPETLVQPVQERPKEVPSEEPDLIDQGAETTPVEKPKETPAALDANVTVLPRVGPRYANTLEKLGIFTLGDMIYHFPRRYDDYSQLKPINRLIYGEEVTVIGSVQNVSTRKIRDGKSKLSEILLSDGSAALRITWFNQPWIAQRLKKGMQIVVSGKVDQYLGRLTMSNPEWESLEQKNLHTNRIVPVYPLTARITQRWLRNLMYKVVDYWAPRVADPLPELIKDNVDILDLPAALKQVHFPDSWKDLDKARYRLAFDEIFLLQLGVFQQKRTWQNRESRVYSVSDDWVQNLLSQLPFELTNAQRSVITEFRKDLVSGYPMNRLLQGDVGSGKTIVAALAIAIVTSHDTQAAIMAPTSILAEQHYNNLADMLSVKFGQIEEKEIRLLLGTTPEAEKQEIKLGLESGQIKLVIGTHALIEDPIEFNNLQLIVIDEQHRFGVQQRAALRSKGTNPHLLVMTATPIPRSLALTIYGDLDLSVMEEMPPGRLPVETHVLMPRERERAYRLIQSQIEAGHQAFIIYPLVEESETSDDKAAVEEQNRLQSEIFPQFKIGLLHGRLKSIEKEEVMRLFRDGVYQILVSTTVIEVGVDVPNATVMLIEGAQRYGLAQLHQLRGRVGRGGTKAFCLLIPQSAESVENERLQAMEETNDGFVLAERDLEQRGAGDFLGTRQSGFSELKMASMTDLKLIETARREAKNLFEIDPDLEQEDHAPLSEAMKRFWIDGQGDLS
jgi:ATP-dependent DNA helicase RecG